MSRFGLKSLFAPVLLCGTVLASPGKAEVYALLIGVADYALLDADLKGPAHDVRLMAETLAARGVAADRMTILSTDPTGLPAGSTSGTPTRAAILAAMDAVAAAAAGGDTVVFYFSGHGAQAPDASGDEGGGYDEILLPADATNWKGEIGAVENALVDDELMAWAQGMLSRDVQLVGLIDACYSATGFRSLAAEGNAKALPPDALGIPEDPGTAPVLPQGPDLQGDFVFLYSSQSDERSFEYPLGDGSVWHGEFTLRLAQVLGRAPEASWAQVLAATAEAMVQGPARQVPEGEGPLLQAQVFGTGQALARLRVEGGKLQAGLLQGIAEGTELALFADGTGGEALATVTVTKVTARDATLSGDIPAGAAWAEVTAAPPPDPLVLAAPVRADAAVYAAWEAVLPAGSAKADLVPILVGGTVALAGPDGVLDPDGPGSTPRVERLGDETEAEALARTLDVMAWGLGLRDTLAGASGKGLTRTPALTVTIEMAPAPVDGDGCGAPGPRVAADPAAGAAPCDAIWLTVTNTSGKVQDVSVLYQATDFSVAAIWPQNGLSNRLAAGETRVIGLQIEPGRATGVEEIWILGVPESDGSAARVDLTRLATPGGSRATAGAVDPMTAWLESRLTDDEETLNRGFSLKPAALTMIRQVVRLEPGAD